MIEIREESRVVLVNVAHILRIVPITAPSGATKCLLYLSNGDTLASCDEYDTLKLKLKL